MNSHWNMRFAGTLAAASLVWTGVCIAGEAPVAKPAENTDKPATESAAVVVVKTTTLENIKTAYIREARAKMRYEAYATKANADGYKSVAALFRATAASEDVMVKKHAAAIKKMSGEVPVLDPIGPSSRATKENLEVVASGSIGEKNTQYLAFAKQAEEEKDSGAMYGFKGAVAAETEYVKLFKQALAGLDGWKDEGKTFAVCEVCSFLVMGPPPATCPVCAAPREKFTVIK